MLGWALTFLIVALIAAVLGFGGIGHELPTDWFTEDVHP